MYVMSTITERMEKKKKEKRKKETVHLTEKEREHFQMFL